MSTPLAPGLSCPSCKISSNSYSSPLLVCLVVGGRGGRREAEGEGGTPEAHKGVVGRRGLCGYGGGGGGVGGGVGGVGVGVGGVGVDGVGATAVSVSLLVLVALVVLLWRFGATWRW